MTPELAIKWLEPESSRELIRIAELNGENPVEYINEAIELAVKALRQYEEE